VIHGSGRRTSPASGVPKASACPRLRQLAQQNQGEEARLAEGLWRPELRRKGEVDDDRRRRGSGSRGKG
jgi:hypothetical protein